MHSIYGGEIGILFQQHVEQFIVIGDAHQLGRLRAMSGNTRLDSCGTAKIDTVLGKEKGIPNFNPNKTRFQIGSFMTGERNSISEYVYLVKLSSLKRLYKSAISSMICPIIYRLWMLCHSLTIIQRRPYDWPSRKCYNMTILDWQHFSIIRREVQEAVSIVNPHVSRDIDWA